MILLTGLSVSVDSGVSTEFDWNIKNACEHQKTEFFF